MCIRDRNWIDAHQGLIRGQGGAMVDKDTMWTGTARDTNTVVAGLSQEMWNTALQEGMIPDWSAILTQSNQIALQVMSGLEGTKISKFAQVVENPKYIEAVRVAKDYVLNAAPFVRHGIKYSPDATFIPESIRVPELGIMQQRTEFAARGEVQKVLNAQRDVYTRLFNTEDNTMLLGKMLDYKLDNTFNPATGVFIMNKLHSIIEALDDKNSEEAYRKNVESGFNLGMFGTGLTYAAQDGAINPNIHLRPSRATWNDGLARKWEAIVTSGSTTTEHENELKYLVSATQELVRQAVNND